MPAFAWDLGLFAQNCLLGHKRISETRKVIFLAESSEEGFYNKQSSYILSACCIHFPGFFGSLCCLGC